MPTAAVPYLLGHDAQRGGLRRRGAGSLAARLAAPGRPAGPVGLPPLAVPDHGQRVQGHAARQHRRQMVPLPENLAAAPYDEDGLALRQAMERLSPQQRAAVALHYFDGLSVEEVSRALGIPKGTVKSRLLYARRNLEQLLCQETEVSL